MPDTHEFKRLRGIILDLDGVVADTEDLHRQAYNLAMVDYGIPVEWSYADYRARLILSAGSKLNELTVPEGLEQADFVKGLYACKREHYAHLLETRELPTRPGILRLLDEAFACGLPVGVASACAKEGAIAILRKCIGKERIERLACLRAGDDALRRKPAPDIYLQALEDMNLTGSSCWAIEDTLHGLESAHAAGLWTLITPSDYTLGDDFADADLLVDDLDSGGVDLALLDNLMLERLPAK